MEGWENTDGVLQVETLWWSRGPYYRVDIHQEALSAQGWLIVGTPEATRTLTAFKPMLRRAAIYRETADRNRETPSLLEDAEDLQT